MKKNVYSLWLLLFPSFLLAQQYGDYLGAGHQNGITVTTSHNQDTTKTGVKSIDGFPVTDPDVLNDAARFLAQATLGADYETIQMTAAMGYEAWLDEQLSLPQASIVNQMNLISTIYPPDGNSNLEGALDQEYFVAAWWQNNLTNPDLLRQRVNLALSEILVISDVGVGVFEDNGQIAGHFYDLLGHNTFGNYRDVLYDVALNPGMGQYLNHINNPKSDPAINIHPDENFAREMMQLFSIGLYELNNDGTRKTDGIGEFIPSYDNTDIGEFAKIWTGLGIGTLEGEFGDDIDEERIESTTLPMKMHDEWHEPGVKNLLNGYTVPAGQTGIQDVNNAIDNLFNHPNVGPFIGKSLIQFLVMSNPSPAYVNRVADAFNNNGQGVRGDMKAVLKAILLDPVARDCNAINNATAGKLREPIVRYTNIARTFNAYPLEQVFYSDMDDFDYETGQIPMHSPSVFNFFQQDYQPNGYITDAGLIAPVFQIHNSITSIGFINEVNHWTFEDNFLPSNESDTDNADLDLSDELALADNPAALVDRLNLLLVCGQLSESTKTIITDAITQLEDANDRLNMAIYLTMMSPDYAVLK